EVPASAIVAHDDLRAPGLAAVLADRGPNTGRHQAISVYRHDPPVGHQHEITRRAEVVDPTQETPGLAAVVGIEQLAPHDPGWIALAAGNAQDSPARKQVAARIEPAVTDEGDARIVVIPVRISERVLARRNEGHEMEFAAVADTPVDERVAVGVVLGDREQEHQQPPVWPA